MPRQRAHQYPFMRTSMHSLQHACEYLLAECDWSLSLQIYEIKDAAVRKHDETEGARRSAQDDEDEACQVSACFRTCCMIKHILRKPAQRCAHSHKCKCAGKIYNRTCTFLKTASWRIMLVCAFSFMCVDTLICACACPCSNNERGGVEVLEWVVEHAGGRNVQNGILAHERAADSSCLHRMSPCLPCLAPLLPRSLAVDVGICVFQEAFRAMQAAQRSQALQKKNLEIDRVVCMCRRRKISYSSRTIE
jgi:hypothetical protein